MGRPDMWFWYHVGCELCVTQLPEISRFLADEGLLILNWFCLWAIEYVGIESKASKALNSSRIVRGITSFFFSIQPSCARRLVLVLSTIQ